MAKMGGGHGGVASETTLHQKGMKTHAPDSHDASMRVKGGSVNAETTRSETAPTPKTLGPRE
jgi:hypothetical protein